MQDVIRPPEAAVETGMASPVSPAKPIPVPPQTPRATQPRQTPPAGSGAASPPAPPAAAIPSTAGQIPAPPAPPPPPPETTPQQTQPYDRRTAPPPTASPRQWSESYVSSDSIQSIGSFIITSSMAQCSGHTKVNQTPSATPRAISES